MNLTREVRRERILDNRNKALKVQEKQAAMLEKVTGLVMTRVIMMMMLEDDEGGSDEDDDEDEIGADNGKGGLVGLGGVAGEDKLSPHSILVFLDEFKY